MQNIVAKYCRTIPLLTFIWGQLTSGCQGQTPDSFQIRQDSMGIFLETQTASRDEIRKLKSVITQIQDTSLAFDWFRFYDSDGICIKTLRSGQFELKHPIYQLNFPRYDPKDKDYFNYYYFKPLEDINYKTGELTPLANRTQKAEELQSLSKYGIMVKKPEKATHIIAKLNSGYTYWNELVTQPAGKYLARVENAVIIDAYDALVVSRYDDLTANSLLDCAYVTIFNHLGDVYKEVLIPDKLLRFALVSDDGKYMVCEAYNVIANETSGGYPISSYLVVDLNTKKIDYLSRPEFWQASGDDPLFADGYFQITFNTSTDTGIVTNRLFIDPYSRNLYMKKYLPDTSKNRKVIRGKSFVRYEGIKEDILQFEKFSY